MVRDSDQYAKHCLFAYANPSFVGKSIAAETREGEEGYWVALVRVTGQTGQFQTEGRHRPHAWINHHFFVRHAGVQAGACSLREGIRQKGGGGVTVEVVEGEIFSSVGLLRCVMVQWRPPHL